MSNSIHPNAIISGEVELGDGNVIGPFAVITGPVKIGDDNWVGAGVTIGAPPEVRDFEHPRSAADHRGNGVIIGNRNVIREYSQIHQGWKSQTRLADDLFIMNQVYVAHDCELESGITIASSVLLAGHVRVGAKANLGLGTSVHQRVRIGSGAMVGMGSVVIRDVPPFAKAFGNPARIRGVNTVGMERSEISGDSIALVSALYGNSSEDFTEVMESFELAPYFEGW